MTEFSILSLFDTSHYTLQKVDDIALKNLKLRKFYEQNYLIGIRKHIDYYHSRQKPNTLIGGRQNMSKQSVWDYLRNKVEENVAVHLTLIDPDPIQGQSPKDAGEIAKIAVDAGTDGIMVGGSTAFGILDETIQEIKQRVNVPVILFPGNISGLSKYADAVFFMSLLNSRCPYWITGAQAMSAPIIKNWGLEAISMAYLLIEPGATAGFVGDANLIPREKPKMAAAYSLAAQYLGVKLVYLEAGSGANRAVPLNMIKTVAHTIDIPLIVGGGLNSTEAVTGCIKAGANIIVQGTFVEKTVPLDSGKALSDIIQAIKKIQK